MTIQETAMLSNEMPSLDLEPDLELILDLDKVFNYLVRLLRNCSITQYIEKHPAAYHEVLAAVQEVPELRPFPIPAYTPREELDTDGQADQYQHRNNLVGPYNRNSPEDKQEFSQEGRPLRRAKEADNRSIEQTSDNSQHLPNLNVWPLSYYNHNIYNQDARQDKQPCESAVASSIPQRLDTSQCISSKRKQYFEDGSVLKRVHIELADASESGPGSSSTGYPTRWTYEKFALRYYLLVPSSSRTSEFQDMANKILTRVIRASTSESFDKYQLGPTEILFCITKAFRLYPYTTAFGQPYNCSKCPRKPRGEPCP